MFCSAGAPRRTRFWRPGLRLGRGWWLAFWGLAAAPAAWSQRPLGTDVSDYQPSVNWANTRAGGVTFAWTKATEGTYYTSPSFASQESGARAAGIYIGAYHYARPSVDPNLTGDSSAQSEANYFWGVASNYVRSGGVYLVPMLDWEDVNATNGYNGFNGFTTTMMSAWVNQWCNTVSNLAQANGVTLKPIVYTGTWYSQPNSVYPGLNSTVTNWPDWIASYPSSPNAQTSAPPSTYPWPSWNVWQYADTNWSGGDSDVFNGTSNTLGALVIGGLSAPVLTSQPVLDPAVDSGGSVTFAASASGATPLNYQWLWNGSPLSGATDATLALSNVTTNQAGTYSLVVTNNSGSATSSPVTLTVYPLQTVVFADNFDTNSAAQWLVNNSSSDNAAGFSFDYSKLGIPSAPHTTNGTTLGLQLKANLTRGICSALSVSPKNQSYAGDYRLHFDAWVNVNGPLPAGGASSTEFLTGGIGTTGNQVEWTTNANADGYYFSADGDGGVSASSTTFGDYSGYIGPHWQNAASGIYDAGSLNHNALYYITANPVGAAPPAGQTSSYPQQTGTLNNGTFGLAWHDFLVAKHNRTVDWVVDGVRLASISNATFTASNVFVGFWDPFASLTDNTNLSFGLVDNLRVEVPALAPTWTQQPVGGAFRLGTNLLLSALATGLPAPAYQWQWNGTNVVGATNNTLTLPWVSNTNAGIYTLTATNIAGSTISSNALVRVLPPAAARFVSAQLAAGVAGFFITGDPYWAYTIQSSTDLVNWVTATNFTSTNGSYFLTVPVTGSAQQFFRVRTNP